jgi:hypothetical protein
MTEDVATTRLRLAEIVKRAETDESFRRQLKDDPSKVLAENNIPSGTVDEFSKALDQAMRPSARRDICIHTDGCNDFTCFSSGCGPTCFVTIHIDPPDA